MRLRTLVVSTLAILSVAACAPAPEPAAVAPARVDPPPGAPPAYTIAETEVVDIHSSILRRDYRLFVALPESYANAPRRRYPVVFVTDADYAFPLVRAIGRRVGDHGDGLEDFILVGLSYAKGDSPAHSRRRDYTPTVIDAADLAPEAPGKPVVHCEAGAYRRFLADEVFPLVGRTWRADMERTVFAGHSYGALLGADILLSEPAMFDHYILGSPSLWFDDGVMFAREQAYARAHDDLPASVYLGIGAYETVNAGSGDARYNRANDMVRDMRRFERALAARRYPSLRIAADVIDGEDHLTVAPVVITRGLQRALPARAGGG